MQSQVLEVMESNGKAGLACAAGFHGKHRRKLRELW